MKVSKLKKNPGNPRQIKGEKLELLKKSVGSFQKMMELRPMIVDEDFVVLGGNMRLAAIKALGLKEIPDTWVRQVTDLTDDEKKEFIIKDNNSFGEYDWDAIANEWSDLPLADWGLDVPGFEAIDEPVGDADAEPQIDKAAELNKKWKVKSGDLWQIGEHRLVCGDSTNAETVSRLMGGERAELFLTDPPYNINFHAQRNKSSYDATDDDLQNGEYLSLLSAVYFTAKEHFDNAIITPGKQNLKLWLTNFEVDEVGCWIAKNKMSGGKVSHLSLWEPVLFLGKFKRDSRATDVFEFNNSFQQEADGHPCPKQPDFFAEFVKCFSSGNVLDSFAGSGTTLVACQNLNRKCYAIEISENYCAVILERMQTAFPDIEIKRIENAKTKGTN